uniref:tryptophan-rich sensory protein n=1 Tax=Phocaeicola massiliensis TaxID=204516 RepID=UPI00402518AE
IPNTYFIYPNFAVFLRVLDIFVIYYMMKSYSIKKMSSLLFIPYILWLLLATYLNGYIMLYN